MRRIRKQARKTTAILTKEAVQMDQIFEVYGEDVRFRIRYFNARLRLVIQEKIQKWNVKLERAVQEEMIPIVDLAGMSHQQLIDETRTRGLALLDRLRKEKYI